MIIELKTIAIKIRTWGLSGVVNYGKAYLGRRTIQRFFIRNARKNRNSSPEFGYTLVGVFTQYASHSKVMRDFAYALKNAGIPFQTYNIDRHPAFPEESISDILTPVADFNIRRYEHVVEILPNIVPRSLGLNLSRIAFWEFESGFLHAYPDITLSPTVIAMSDFNARYFRKILPPTVNIRKILYPFHAVSCSEEECRAIRTRYGIGPDDFMVFFNFDFGSSYYRKNPEGALRAFAQALGDKPDARLVFKTMRSDSRPDLVQKLRSLAEELGMTDRLILISDYLQEREIFALTGSCDVYLSLHRGEGFGITLAEAMSMGRPVICTDYSSTTEFCRPDGTLPIPYRMVPVPHEQIDHPYYRDVTEWAEPDLSAAANALLRLYESPALCIVLGTRAEESIARQFSIERFRHSAT